MAANNAFPATSNGVCRRCEKPILVGQLVQKFNLPNPGSLYHLDCEHPAGVTSTTWGSNPDLEKIIAGILAKQQSVAPEIAPQPKTPEKPKLDEQVLLHGPWWEKGRILNAYFDRLLFVGPPGPGKSTYLSTLNPKTMRIVCHEEASTGDIRGMWQLRDRETIFADGPSTMCLREGRTAVYEEIERFSMECRSLLFNLLDMPGHDTLPSGEVVTATSGYKVFATTNEVPESLPAALLDRFELTVFCYTPSPGITSQLAEDIAPVTANFYTALAKQRVHYKPAPTARTSLVYSRLRKLGVSQECALALVFHDAAKEIASTMVTAAAAQKAGAL